MTVDKMLMVCVVVGVWAIAQYYLERGQYRVAERIGWGVFAVSLLYLGMDIWMASVEEIRAGYFERAARAKFRSISYYRIITTLKGDPMGFWANVVVRLIVCAMLIYSSTWAVRRAMKRG